MRRSAHITVLCFMALPCFAQNIKQHQADLSGAQKISISREYSFENSPSGYGNVKEFAVNQHRSPIFFKEERNTKWFLIEVPFSGDLTFELTPEQTKDDYDWMLFKYSATLKEEIQNETAEPVRTNNSRNDPAIQSRTGLNSSADILFTKPGRHPSYSKLLKVAKGEKYALIVDNIYGNGRGFKIKVEIKPEFRGPFATIEGFIKDKRTNKRLKGEVLFEDDSTASIITRVISDESGYYKTTVPINRPVNGIATHPLYLFSTADFRLKDTVTKRMDFLLDTIAKDKKLILFNVHFQPNKDLIVPRAIPELDRLLLFLKKEERWNVRIVGHTNNNVFADSRYLQQLSFNRALAIKRFLIENGISERRLSCTGLGGKTPFVKTRDPEEGLKNLRVEIILERKEL